MGRHANRGINYISLSPFLFVSVAKWILFLLGSLGLSDATCLAIISSLLDLTMGTCNCIFRKFIFTSLEYTVAG